MTNHQAVCVLGEWQLSELTTLVVDGMGIVYGESIGGDLGLAEGILVEVGVG